MSRSCAVVLLAALLPAASCRKSDTTPPPVVSAGVDAGAGPTLTSVGPRLLSNQTSQPLAIVGAQLAPGARLALGAPVNRDLPLTVLDATHAFARLPAGIELGREPEVVVPATLVGGRGSRELRLINDTAFPDLAGLALSPDGAFAWVVSGTTDTVFRVDVATGEVKAFSVGDGPSAIAPWVDASGRPWMVVAHQYEKALWLISTDGLEAELRTLPGPASAAGLTVDSSRAVAFVAEQARDTVAALALDDGAKELWRTPVLPNPRELALTAAGLVVGSLQTGALEVLDAKTGAVRAQWEPGPGTPIIGGGTAAFSKYVMNGKAPRGLAWSAKKKTLFVASIGPNVGPNPEKLEVSMNGGVAAVDLAKGWRRHLGFGAGVTEALALDDANGLLYASDVSLGLVRVLDAAKLAKSDDGAAGALLQEVALPPPEGFPLIRKEADFGVQGRAGRSLHSGPRALALSRDAKTLFVLNRFTGTLAVVDVSKAKQKKAQWKRQWPVTPVLAQRIRRLGQVLYFADLGRTAMSCDACHLEGHTEGVLFEKTMPLRIYRSTTVRGSRETPPHFTPASTTSMGMTAAVVGGRNRFHNPDPTPAEVEALTVYASTLPTLPNPFVGDDGAPVEALLLPDGTKGNPRRGLALFEGKAECVKCHPPPLFTLDQDVATRGRFLDVGTPHVMPLREEWQNTRFEGFGTPSLNGSWDVFPMLTTGLAGLGVTPDGRVQVTQRFALKTAVEAWAPKHGRADLLDETERRDLLAYVLSL